MTKCSAPQEGNYKFKTFRCTKTKFKAYTTTQRNVFIIDLFIFLIEFNSLLGDETP